MKHVLCPAFVFLLLVGCSQTDRVFEREGEIGWIRDADFSADGSKIVTASVCDGIVRIWEIDPTVSIWKTEPGKELKKFRHTSHAYSVAFSPDETKIVTGCKDGTIRVWDVESGKELRMWKGHAGRGCCSEGVLSVAFSPDGTKIATASEDQTARIWDADTGKELHKLEGHTNKVCSIAFSSDGQKLVTAGRDGMPRIWDVKLGKELQRLEGHTSGTYSVAFSPNGKKISTGSTDGTVRIWDVESGKELQKLEGHSLNHSPFPIFLPDGKGVLTSTWDQTSQTWTTQIWDTDTGGELQKLEERMERLESIRSYAFSPDGTKVFIGAAKRENLSLSAKWLGLVWDMEKNEVRTN